MNHLPEIIKLDFLSDYNIKILFDDKIEKIINYSPYIKNGVSKALEDVSYFRSGKIEDGYLVWPNGYDCCPKFLYEL